MGCDSQNQNISAERKQGQTLNHRSGFSGAIIFRMHALGKAEAQQAQTQIRGYENGYYEGFGFGKKAKRCKTFCI